ncbi:MAG: Transcriptional regulatory protein ZraR [Verrucomicrobiota bacterium]|jgi:DNA-binding NtrC family response regulator
MMIQRILLVAAESLRPHLAGERRVRSVPTLAEAQQALDEESADLVLAAGTLPDGAALDLVPHLETMPGHPLLVVLTEVNEAPGIEDGVAHGVFDFLAPAPSGAALRRLLLRVEELRRARRAATRHGLPPEEDLLGASPATQELRTQIRRAARTDATTLIQGEAHTGKKLVAHLIHRISPRAEAPLLHLDCAAGTEAQLHSALFGTTAKGTTPATAGLLTLAHGGTLLLEEIAALPLVTQDRLLQVIESRSLPGSSAEVNVRLIATTARDLPALAQRQAFRESLFHALNLFPLRTTPLRDRLEDLVPLADHFRALASRRHGRPVLALAPTLGAALRQHAWPGNLRELHDAIERAVLHCTDAVLEPAHLAPAHPSPGQPGLVTAESELLETAEKQHILAILTRCQGNRTHAARRLGISLRTLRNKLRDYRLESTEGGADIPPPRLGIDPTLLSHPAAARQP